MCTAAWTALPVLANAPYMHLRSLNNIIHQVTSDLISIRAAERTLTVDTLSKLSITIKILRTASDGKLTDTATKTFVSRYHFLHQFSLSGSINLPALRHEANRLLEDADVDARNDSTAPIAGPFPSQFPTAPTPYYTTPQQRSPRN